jgi:dUTP pyrophosphatase
LNPLPTLRFRGALTGEEIRTLIESDTPLVSDYVDLEEQIQPNGIDLTLGTVWVATGAGTIGRSNADRALPPRQKLPPRDGVYALARGAYIVGVNEILQIPDDLMALGASRSSLLRCGVAVHNAVWDAGYHGRSEVLLSVLNPSGFVVATNARIVQLVFIGLTSRASAYSGRYQGENVRSR